jgi:L-threonylcarbamoyladenylate synthase
MKLMPMSLEAWKLAAEVLSSGGLVVFPTDTVYGIACDPYNLEAIAKIYEAKHRPAQKALPLLLSGEHRVDMVAEGVPPAARKLAVAFWPGALTLVLRRRETVPEALSGGDTIAVRVPNHDELRAFIESYGGAVAATSANLSGQPDAVNARQAAEYFRDTVDLIIDGGPSPGGVPSTVVNCVVDPPQVLREGALSERQIRQALEA